MFELIPSSRRNFGLVSQMLNQMQDFHNHFFSPVKNGFSSIPVNVREEGTQFTLEAQLPGARKEDVEIHYENNYLTIKANQKHEKEVKNDQENFIHREFSSSQFSRSFYFEDIEEEKIKAKFENGILTLTLPKKDQKIPTQKRIEIE